jgi:3-isopropylmalate/(R)-2-methylmalate dehydratase small subunit
MGKPTILSGRCWLITGENGELIDDIDTDMIFHNAHLAITELAQMGRYAFGNLEGWTHFAAEAQPGDIVLVGKNFGAGSSRQQAVDCFIALGVQAIVAESFGAIYKRNAINSGFPILGCPGLGEALRAAGVKHLEPLQINLATGEIRRPDGSPVASGQGFSTVQMEIYQAGGLFEFGRSLTDAGRDE